MYSVLIATMLQYGYNQLDITSPDLEPILLTYKHTALTEIDCCAAKQQHGQ